VSGFDRVLGAADNTVITACPLEYMGMRHLDEHRYNVDVSFCGPDCCLVMGHYWINPEAN